MNINLDPLVLGELAGASLLATEFLKRRFPAIGAKPELWNLLLTLLLALLGRWTGVALNEADTATLVAHVLGGSAVGQVGFDKFWKPVVGALFAPKPSGT
jgi:glycerol uptake facilitator-like aquaporin